MYKEIIIITLVIAFIAGLDIITNSFTIYAGDKLSEELTSLREYILKEDKQNIEKNIKEIENNWDKYNKRLSYYMEHDELEKVGSSLTSLKAYIDMEEYADSIEKLDECIFILQHIEEKEKFSVGSLF